MKKLLILMALCMIICVAFVACNDEQNPDETTAGTTEAPTTQAPTTEAPTTEAPTTEEPTTEGTTEEPTTEEPTTDGTTEEPTTEGTTEGTEPDPEPVKVKAGMSWDSLSTVHPVWNKPIFDGSTYGTWNGVAAIDSNDSALHVFGWVAYFTETEGTVGYSINGSEIVYGDGFTSTAEEGVQKHIATAPDCAGAKSACRMHFDIPMTDLDAGEHKVAIYAKDTDNNVELIREFTVTIAAVDAVEPLEAVAFDGTNGTITLEANGTYKFKITNYGGKTITITNSANCVVIAGDYTLPADTIGEDGTTRTQAIPEPGNGFDDFVLTIHNNGDEAIEIVLNIQ